MKRPRFWLAFVSVSATLLLMQAFSLGVSGQQAGQPPKLQYQNQPPVGMTEQEWRGFEEQCQQFVNELYRRSHLPKSALAGLPPLDPERRLIKQCGAYQVRPTQPPPGPVPESSITDEDFEVFAKAFEKTGFRGGLNWYRNFDRNWEDMATVEQRVNQPALMITAELDVVLRPEMAEGMNAWVPNLRKTVLIKGSGHWTQQEKPGEVNAAILEFLSDMKK